MPEGVSLEFRSDDIERMEIAERNKKVALSVLEQAGISPDNPQYNQYYALTLANVHHAGRYGVYDGHIEKQFVETLKDPELSIEQYREATKLFEAEMAKKQMDKAEGSTFSSEKNNTPYSEIRNILNDTTRSGVELRNTLNTTYPKEFYNEDGSLKRRLVVDIPPEMMEDSAMGTIGLITKKYKNVTFDKEKNSFVVKGKSIGPEKFFKNKKELLDKFKIESLDMEDSELLDIVRQGSYEKFMELRKERGMNRNKTNEQLRNVLNDEVVFGEVSEKLRGVEMSKEHIAQMIKGVAEDFDAKAKIIRTEADKATLDSIDRVMFSISPADVARQSTFQDWKSCMHAVGCNHRFVDDSIGVGSVIAYGYNSQNPQKMVSRLLIHPYVNDAGEVAYGVNNRIYGKENLAFRKVVNQVTKENFNAGKEGVFSFNGKLYNDNAGSDKLKLVKFNEGEFIEIDNRYVANGVLDLAGMDFSKAGGLSFSGKFREIILCGIKFPEHMKQLDLSKFDNINLAGVNLSQFEDLKLPERIKGLSGTKFPALKQLDVSNCYNIDLSGADLSQIEDLKLPERIKGLSGTKFPETLKQLDLSNCYDLDLSEADLSQFEDLKLPSSIESLEGIKLPKKLDLSNCYALDLSGADLSQFEDLKLPSNIRSLKETKFPETLKQLDLSNCYGLDLSGVDLSQFDDLKLPSNIESLEGLNLPKKLDITSCHSLKLTEADLARFDELTVGNCSNMDLSTFKGKLNLSQEQELQFINAKLPQTMHSLDLTGKQALFQNTDLSGIQELKLPEYFFSGMEQAGEKIEELCGGDESKLEKMSISIISPDCKLDNLKKLDVSLCKNADLRDWNLDKIEELKLPKNFDVSKLPEGIMERNPAVARAVKISQGEIVETLEQTVVKEKVLAEQEVKAGAMPPPIEKQLQQEAKTEKTSVKMENPAEEKIQQLRGVENSGAQAAAEAGEKVAEKAAEAVQPEKTADTEMTGEEKKKVRDIILQKQGRVSSEVQTQVQQVSQQNNNYALQQKAAQQGRE